MCGVSRDGTSALQVTAAAEHLGLSCDGYSVESSELEELKLPGILFWGFDHFVVLEGWKGGRWRIMDPALGRRWVDPAEFDRKFTGVVLELEPTDAPPTKAAKTAKSTASEAAASESGVRKRIKHVNIDNDLSKK